MYLLSNKSTVPDNMLNVAFIYLHLKQSVRAMPACTFVHVSSLKSEHSAGEHAQCRVYLSSLKAKCQSNARVHLRTCIFSQIRAQCRRTCSMSRLFVS